MFKGQQSTEKHVKQQRANNTAFEHNPDAFSLGVGDEIPQLQEISDPTAGYVWNMKLGKLVLQQCHNNDVDEGKAEVYKQDTGTGYQRVQELEDEVENHVDSIIHRALGSVGELEGVQKKVCDDDCVKE